MVYSSLFASFFSAPEEYSPFGVVIIILAVLILGLVAIKTVVDLINGFRRTPSADDKYATKIELSAVEGRMLASEARLFRHVEDLGKRVDSSNDREDKQLNSIISELRSISSRIGRLEGKFEGKS